MEHRGEITESIVATPVDDYVIGVSIASRSHILPRVEDGVVPIPDVPACCDHHIIRTPESVVVIEINAKITSFPRIMSYSLVGKEVMETTMEALEEEGVKYVPEAYVEALKFLTQRAVQRMRGYGVEVTEE